MQKISPDMQQIVVIYFAGRSSSQLRSTDNRKFSHYKNNGHENLILVLTTPIKNGFTC